LLTPARSVADGNARGNRKPRLRPLVSTRLSGSDIPKEEGRTRPVMAYKVVAAHDGPLQPASFREYFIAGKTPFSVTFALQER